MSRTSVDIIAVHTRETAVREEGVARSAEARSVFAFRGRRTTDRDRINFCAQLSVMLLSRVPLNRALEVQELQTKSPAMKSIIGTIRADIAGGASVSLALSKHREVFDELFVASAEVGEESGRLGQTLASLAEHLEKMAGLKKKLLQALTYPALVLCVAAGTVGFLLAFIVPTFADVFKSFEMELSWSTRAVMRLSAWLTSYGPYTALSSLVLAFLAREWFRSPRARRLLEAFAIRVPYIGSVILENYLARFCRTLGTLLQSQVSLVDALATTKRITAHDQLRREVSLIEDAVRQGRNVASPVLESQLFPPMVAQMIVVGEETSELDEMLLKVGAHYEREIDAKIESLSNVIEPVIILFVGVIVAGILVAMYLPMFDLVNLSQ